MTSLYLISLIISVGLWIVLLAWRLDFGKLSAWQLHRKRQRFNAADQLFLRRWAVYPLLRTVIVISSGMLASWCWVLVFQLQPNVWWAIAAWLGVWLLVLVLARLKLTVGLAEKCYLKLEPRLLPLLERLANWRLPLLDQPVIKPPQLTSRTEFGYLLEQDQTVFSSAEKQILTRLPDFLTATLDEVMLSLDDLLVLETDELLGPLKINELYESNRQFFLVRQDEQIIGLLKLDQLTEIKTSQTFRAGDLAQREYPELASQLTLPEALNELVRANQTLAVVRKGRQIVGLVELKTILTYLKLIAL